MPEFTMFIACAPHADEAVRERAGETLGGTVLIDDPVEPTYNTTISADSRDAAAASVTATLAAAGMTVRSIKFAPDITPGAGGPRKPQTGPGRSVLTSLREQFTTVVDRLIAPPSTAICLH